MKARLATKLTVAEAAALLRKSNFNAVVSAKGLAVHVTIDAGCPERPYPNGHPDAGFYPVTPADTFLKREVMRISDTLPIGWSVSWVGRLPGARGRHVYKAIRRK